MRFGVTQEQSTSLGDFFAPKAVLQKPVNGLLERLACYADGLTRAFFVRESRCLSRQRRKHTTHGNNEESLAINASLQRRLKAGPS